MKTSARFLAVILAVLMIAGTALTVSAFSDVEEGYAHASAIATLNQLGVIGGYEDGTFKPENNVERDEMAKLIFVLYTTLNDAGKGTVKFNDVASDNWAAGYVSWCAAKSIVGGYGDGNFKPDNNVTYDEALKMTCAALGYTDFDSNLWPTDVRQKGLKELKLGEGIEANGGDKLTRGEVAQLLYNALFVDMNETKVTYVYDMSYEDGNGNKVPVKVPVEVAKTLAADVWAFDEITYRVVGTENYTFGTNATKAANDKSLKAQAVKADGSLDATVVTLVLEDYGLEAFEKKTDELIGLDIMTVSKDGEIIPGAEVLGVMKTAEVVISGKDEADVVIADEVKIDGVLYDDAAKSDYQFDELKVLNFGVNGAVDTNSTFTGTSVALAELEYPHMALVLDSEGDGVVDAIAVDYYKLAKVVKVENVKATSNTEAYTKYYFDADITATSSQTYIKSTDIADGKTLAKDDVFVYGQINGVTYIAEVLKAVNSKATKVTTGENAAITLADGAVKYIDGANGATYLKNSGVAITFNAATLLDKDTKAADYYIYNGYVVAATTVSVVADSYDLALLLYVKKPDAPVYNTETKKMEVSYPAVLLIDGKETTVNLKAIDNTVAAVNNNVYSLAQYEIGTDANGYATYAYELVNYTIDDDGLYTLKTTANDLGDTDVIAAGATITLNENTGLYTIAGKSVELDDKSVIYYTYDNSDVEATDTYKYLGTYTKANILKKFQPVVTTAEAYVLENEDGTFTLLATVIGDELDAPASLATKTFANDARLIKYCAEGSAAESVDGVAYYSYLFLDMETMKNGGQVVDTTLSIDKGAVPTSAGYFYGWDENAKKYVKVTENETTAVKVATITAVDATRNILYLNGAAFNVNGVQNDFTNGVIVNDGVKIFGNAGNNVYTYTTFTVATLKELFELASDNQKTLDAAVGVYVDDNDTLQIAWIIVDNYYYVTANDGTETLTQASDIVSRIEGAAQGI